MILKDIVGKNVLGWKPQAAYFMEISHHLMGCFPAIDAKRGRIVVCLDRGDLEKIWANLPRKEVKVHKAVFYVNKKDRLAVLINGPKQENASSDAFFLVLSADLPGYLKKKSFKWSSGILSLKDESKAVFPQDDEA